MRKTKAQEKKHQDYLENLGARIIVLRKKKGLSQNDLALECGWDKPNLRRIEKGRTNPTVKSLLVLCEGLEVDMATLFDF